jgi:uncharacterized phage protein (TIGR01671 family)
MRENIGLFKAKRKDNGEWVEGSFLNSRNPRIIINGEYIKGLFVVDSFEIDPETLCRCTELPDKNKKLIFENDYVKQEVEMQGYSSGEPNDDLSFFGCICGTVKFQPSAGFFIQVSGVEDYITGEKTKENWKTRKRIVSYRTEVIGNKFDSGVESESNTKSN